MLNLLNPNILNQRKVKGLNNWLWPNLNPSHLLIY